MPKERLHKILDDLRAELRSTESLAEEDRSRLRRVVDQIHNSLEETDEPETENGSLLDSLDEAALHFEADHPRLTKALYQISELLRSAGIA